MSSTGVKVAAMRHDEALSLVDSMLAQLQRLMTNPPEGADRGKFALEVAKALAPIRSLRIAIQSLGADEAVIRWRPYYEPSLSPRLLVARHGELQETQALVFGHCVLGEIPLPDGGTLLLVAYAQREKESTAWEESYGVEMLSRDGERVQTGTVPELAQAKERLLRRYLAAIQTR